MDRTGSADPGGPDWGRHARPPPRPRTQGHQGPLGSHVHLRPSPHQPRPPGPALTRPQEAPAPPCPPYTHAASSRKGSGRAEASCGPHLAVRGATVHGIPWLPAGSRGTLGQTLPRAPDAPGQARGTGKSQKSLGAKTQQRLGLPSGLRLCPPLPVCETRAGRSPAHGQSPEGQWRIKSIHPRSPRICEGSKKHWSPFATGNQLRAASKPSFPTQWPENLYPTPEHVHARTCTHTHTHTLHPFTS